MKVKNISTRLHHVGDVAIAPGATAEVPKEWANAINRDELVEVLAKVTSKAPPPPPDKVPDPDKAP